MKIVKIIFGFVNLLIINCRGDGLSSENSPNDLNDNQVLEGTDSGLEFVPPRGVYESPFDLTVTHDTSSEILYTLDGSDPRTSTSVLTASLPLVIRIDPADTEHRYRAPGVIVRAVAGGADSPNIAVVTHTYLFINKVVSLSPDGESPGGDWPQPVQGGGRTGIQRIDYGMDPDITDSPEYGDLIENSLRSIPSFSLVTELSNLFDSQTGIYVNASEREDEWERFGSMEILYADDRPPVQANTGIRIRGGYSRRPENPKHGFRLFFRSTWGTAKLRYALFESEGVTEFDKIDLRTAQNYAWSAEATDSNVSTMTRDVFSRDLQREIGRPYTRSRYYHLYINGVYWGLFQTQERAEARYAASYFGGNSDDYDVIKVDTSADYTIEATDGNLDAWREVWQLCTQGFSDNSTYYTLEGKDSAGIRDASMPVLVDVDNLIDYMLVIFYTGNYDGPVSKFFSNQNPNNFYAIRSRLNAERGFVFFAHDNEHTLMADRVSITTGVNENRVSIGQSGGATDDNGRTSSAYVMNVTNFNKFHPQWLHHRLTSNALYRERFATRARVILSNGGDLSSSKTIPLFQSRADEIDLATIAESARWGDAHTTRPRTRNDDWLPAVERAKTGFIGQRTEILISQLQAADLY